MLISGSFALQFLDRTIYEDSDLDLYCNFQGRHMIGRWLMEREGYSFAPNSLQDPSFNVASAQAPQQMDLDPYATLRGISTIFTFTKGSEADPSNLRKVQLIVVHRSPMEAILNYHSTTVMNVIAYDCAYSLYPRATFEERLFLLCVRKSHRHVAAIEKYRSRGFSILHEKAARDPVMWKIFEASLFPTTIPRWMGDRHTWRLPLSLDGVHTPAPFSEGSRPPTTDPCFVTSWTHELAVNDIDLTTSLPVRVVSRIKYDVINVESYTYQYVSAPGFTMRQVMSVMLMLRDLYSVAIPGTPFVDEELFQYFKQIVQGRRAWEDWHKA